MSRWTTTEALPNFSSAQVFAAACLFPRRHSSTVPEAFELSTERRARERQEYERAAGEKEAMRAMMEEEQKREEEQRAREEIARLRQEQVSG